MSFEDSQRMQRGYSGRLTDNNGHRTLFAGICHGFTSYMAESSSVLKVLCSSKLFARMKLQWTDARWIERMKYVCNEYTTDAYRFPTDGKSFYVLFASVRAVGPGLYTCKPPVVVTMLM